MFPAICAAERRKPGCANRERFLIAVRCNGPVEPAEFRRRRSPRARAAAFSVHIFTATGRGHWLIAMLEAVREHWAAMFAWLGLALVVDALDGPLARRLDVERLQPNWSGEVLDLVVDFRHLCVRAGLCDHRQRAADAGGWRRILGAGIVDIRRALFRRSPHEDRRQSFPRFSGAVECRGVLSVSAAYRRRGSRASRSRP